MNDIQRHLTGMVYQAVKDSNPEAIAHGFDASAWLQGWLQQSLPALGGLAPCSILDTPEGQVLVTTVLRQALGDSFA